MNTCRDIFSPSKEAPDEVIAQLATQADLNYNLQRGERKAENASALRAFNSYLSFTNLLYFGPAKEQSTEPKKIGQEISY